MPKVPDQGINMGGEGKSPLTQVDPINLLMASATMQNQGSFSIPSAKDTHPNPTQKRPVRKLKVVK